MNGLISLAAIIAMLLGAGALIGLHRRDDVRWRWLLAAAALVILNGVLLTRCYGLIPDMLPGERNWLGKLLALAATIAIATLPAFGRRDTGLTLSQRDGSLKTVIPVAACYYAFFTLFAWVFLNDGVTGEDLAFQLTLPGLEEEAFYRGLLLFALDRAFLGRVRLLGIEWGWGAILSCALFGLAHAFGYSADGFSFDMTTMALTALPSFIAVWVRVRTGSIALPILMHNFGNTIFLLV